MRAALGMGRRSGVRKVREVRQGVLEPCHRLLVTARPARAPRRARCSPGSGPRACSTVRAKTRGCAASGRRSASRSRGPVRVRPPVSRPRPGGSRPGPAGPRARSRRGSRGETVEHLAGLAEVCRCSLVVAELGAQRRRAPQGQRVEPVLRTRPLGALEEALLQPQRLFEQPAAQRIHPRDALQGLPPDTAEHHVDGLVGALEVSLGPRLRRLRRLALAVGRRRARGRAPGCSRPARHSWRRAPGSRAAPGPPAPRVRR